jgi:hypothetical protein
MDSERATLALTKTLLLLLTAFGCTQEMYDQPRHEPLEASDFFEDGKSARQAVEGTVARGQLWLDDRFFTGESDGEAVQEIPPDPRLSTPFHVTRETLERGRQRFNIFCAMCHGRAGYGDGIIVRRGFRKPPSLHEPRLREETPAGHYFRVITNGFKTMPAQASRISPTDRWAIVAYVHVLQKSQHVPLDEAPQDIRRKFE